MEAYSLQQAFLQAGGTGQLAAEGQGGSQRFGNAAGQDFAHAAGEDTLPAGLADDGMADGDSDSDEEEEGGRARGGTGKGGAGESYKTKPRRKASQKPIVGVRGVARGGVGWGGFGPSSPDGPAWREPPPPPLPSRWGGAGAVWPGRPGSALRGKGLTRDSFPLPVPAGERPEAAGLLQAKRGLVLKCYQLHKLSEHSGPWLGWACAGLGCPKGGPVGACCSTAPAPPPIPLDAAHCS
jgi:hypothetical protein